MKPQFDVDTEFRRNIDILLSNYEKIKISDDIRYDLVNLISEMFNKYDINELKDRIEFLESDNNDNETQISEMCEHKDRLENIISELQADIVKLTNISPVLDIELENDQKNSLLSLLKKEINRFIPYRIETHRNKYYYDGVIDGRINTLEFIKNLIENSK